MTTRSLSLGGSERILHLLPDTASGLALATWVLQAGHVINHVVSWNGVQTGAEPCP